MDLGLQGRSAIVCASSRGLGYACALALASEGVDVIVNGRTATDVEAAVARIGQLGAGTATGVVADVATQTGRAALLAACAEPDILVNNCGGPSPMTIDALEQEDLQTALDGNMIAPLMLTKAVLPAMKRRTFGRIINITSAMVTTPRAHMPASAGARAGLTAAMKAISLQFARYNVTVNNLLPERIDTDRQHFMALETADREGISYDEARARQVRSIAARRLGRPEEFGAICAFVASGHASFVSGQNIHLDGGSYPALV